MAFDPNQYRMLPYALNLRENWCSHKGIVDTRKGWLISTTNNSGLTGFGDCAPLPAAGTESHEAAASCLDKNALPTGLPIPDELASRCPAAACGIEMALLDLASKSVSVPLSRYLNRSAAKSVQVNGIAAAPDTDAFTLLEDQGYRVIKVKVGLKPLSMELGRLREIASSLKSARLRLDANGAWNHDQARIFLSEAENLPVESIEEPLANPTLSALRTLQQNTRIPIAIDESLGKLGLQNVTREKAVARVVLKPMVLGGISRAFEAAQLISGAGMETVVTTTVDSAAGVWATVQLAAAIDPLCPGMHHGLATSSWLAQDVGAPPEIRQGEITLSEQPGTGFTPYEHTFQI